MKWFENRNEHFWIGVIIFAILLNLFAMYNSDYGLDVHVKSSYVEIENGYVLDWGDLRQSDPNASNPDEATIVDMAPMIWNPLIGMALLIIFALMVPLMKNNRPIIAIILLHPTVVFSTGKIYDELTLISLFGLGALVLEYSYSKNQHNKPSFILNMLAYSIMITALMLKVNFDSIISLFGIGIIVAIVTTLSINRIKTDARIILLSGFILGLIAILLLGIFGYGTSQIIIDEPLRFIYALPFAILDVVIIYSIFGMILWPFLKSTWEKMGEIEDAYANEFAFIIGGMSGLITMYVAVLWAYESILWDSEWPWHMFTMGNNGRYITIILIPIWILIKRVHGEIDWANRNLLVGLMLILPLSLTAGLHGQTMWTDDASEAMELNDDEHFLFVSDATLGMHWLYTFHNPLDADEKNITGHWRSDESNWMFDLNNNLSHINWIVLAPEIEETPEGWKIEKSGNADFLNGGGEWKVMTRT